MISRHWFQTQSLESPAFSWSLKKKGGGEAALKAFLSLRGRPSLQRKDAEQGTGRKPQKSKDPVQKEIGGCPEAGTMGTDFLKKSDLMDGLESSRRKTDRKEDI